MDELAKKITEIVNKVDDEELEEIINNIKELVARE